MMNWCIAFRNNKYYHHFHERTNAELYAAVNDWLASDGCFLIFKGDSQLLDILFESLI